MYLSVSQHVYVGLHLYSQIVFVCIGKCFKFNLYSTIFGPGMETFCSCVTVFCPHL